VIGEKLAGAQRKCLASPGRLLIFMGSWGICRRRPKFGGGVECMSCLQQVGDWTSQISKQVGKSETRSVDVCPRGAPAISCIMYVVASRRA
jgi:hypothetical protein